MRGGEGATCPNNTPPAAAADHASRSSRPALAKKRIDVPTTHNRYRIGVASGVPGKASSRSSGPQSRRGCTMQWNMARREARPDCRAASASLCPPPAPPPSRVTTRLTFRCTIDRFPEHIVDRVPPFPLHFSAE